jgi:hypothetical protein
LGIIHSIKHHYRKQLIQKTAAKRKGRLLGCVVSSDIIAETWRLITTTTIKNCFVRYGFLIDHDSNNEASAVKLSDDEEDDWQSFQPLGVQLEDYTTCDSALEVCGIQNVNHMLEQFLTRPEEREVPEHKTTLLDVLK